MICEGIFCSKLCYLSTVWAGTEEYLLSALQRIQNKAARLVTKSSRQLSVKQTLQVIGWPSVQQMGLIDSLTQVKKVLTKKEPIYLYEKLVGTQVPLYTTRLVAAGELRPSVEPRTRLCASGWRHRMLAEWPKVPREIRELEGRAFSRAIKQWVINNYPV